MSYLRDYQQEAKDAVYSELSNGSDSTLVVLPTGCGKTEVGLDIVDSWENGNVLWLAHREELVWQPFDRWRKKTGEYAEMSMADIWRSQHRGGSIVTFGSKDTLYRQRRLRAEFPDPKSIGMLVIDEAHHAVRNNKTYQTIIDYFASANPDLKILGLTATPDRTDEQALGQTFNSVAFDFPLLDPAGGPSAIGDGWLCPIQQQYVTVEELDFDEVGTRGGDFIDSALEKQILQEKPLHRITSATVELAGLRTTLCFAAGIEQAILEAEIFNRHRDSCAYAIASRIDEEMRHDFVVNSADKQKRRRVLKRWGKGDFQFFCNVGVFTEGMDEPTIGCISMGRPTKSRSLYAQMAGRGTRVLPGIIEGKRGDEYWRLSSPEERKAAIAASAKPFVSILDFVGNSKHRLISTADILGGRYPDEVVERAKKKIVDEAERGGDVQKILAEAEEEIRQADLDRRKRLTAQARVSTRLIDPFAVVGVAPTREPGWHKGRKPTSKQKAALEKFKLSPRDIEGMSFWQASKMLDNLIGRAKEHKATFKQCAILAKYGEPVDVSFQEASKRIDAIARNGWKPITAPA